MHCSVNKNVYKHTSEMHLSWERIESEWVNFIDNYNFITNYVYTYIYIYIYIFVFLYGSMLRTY